MSNLIWTIGWKMRHINWASRSVFTFRGKLTLISTGAQYTFVKHWWWFETQIFAIFTILVEVFFFKCYFFIVEQKHCFFSREYRNNYTTSVEMLKLLAWLPPPSKRHLSTGRHCLNDLYLLRGYVSTLQLYFMFSLPCQLVYAQFKG